MEFPALIKEEDGVETTKICRWCLSAGEALEARANDDSGQCNLQKLSECTGAQIESSTGVPSYLCTMCEARLKKMNLFRWRCNENNDLVDRFIEQQNTVKNESEITQEHLDHSAEHAVGTEVSIKTEVTSPDAAKDLHLNRKCFNVHQANMTYECCGKIPDDLFEAEENPIAIKSEYEEVDEHHHLQTTNDVLNLEQDNQKTNSLESVCQDQKHHPVTVADNTCADDSVAASIPNVLSSGTRNAHSKSHSKNHKHHCPHCSAVYPFLSGLKVHIRTHTGERPYVCKICKKTFRSSFVLVQHSKIHNKDQQHQCPYCSSSFAQPSNLKAHIRTHTGEKPYQCKICDKAFTRSRDLKVHIRTHTGEKPYKCKVCDKAFHSSGNLAEHSKIHNKDQQHQCPHCSSRFAQSSNLKIHIRTHTGEKPYKCKVCDKAFTSSTTLAQHSKLHNKDQQYQCPHCSLKLAQSSNLKIHIPTHTGEKPYKCKACGKAFSQSGILVRHSKIHKKDEPH